MAQPSADPPSKGTAWNCVGQQRRGMASPGEDTPREATAEQGNDSQAQQRQRVARKSVAKAWQHDVLTRHATASRSNDRPRHCTGAQSSSAQSEGMASQDIESHSQGMAKHCNTTKCQGKGAQRSEQHRYGNELYRVVMPGQSVPLPCLQREPRQPRGSFLCNIPN